MNPADIITQIDLDSLPEWFKIFMASGGTLGIAQSVKWWKEFKSKEKDKNIDRKEDVIDKLEAEIKLLKQMIEEQNALIVGFNGERTTLLVQMKEYETALKLLTPFFDKP